VSAQDKPHDIQRNFNMNRRNFLSLLSASAAALPLIGDEALAQSAAKGGKAIASGSFKGASNHVTRGTVRVVQSGTKTTIAFDADFFFDGAPDPKIGFGKNGFVKSSLIGPLKQVKGAQTYDVPASVDVRSFNEVWVWCEKFNVPLGVASLK
jgi:Electron transfer DM13